MEKHILNKADSYPDFVPLDEKEFSKQMEQIVVPFLQKLKKTYTLKTTHGSELYGETVVPRPMETRLTAPSSCCFTDFANFVPNSMNLPIIF
ncbi:hypothetical protein [Treponema lecithinolyticum]